MAERVDPIIARQGEFIDSFPWAQKAEMLRHVENMEWILRRSRIKSRIVYTFINAWGYPDHFGTWQVYLLRG